MPSQRIGRPMLPAQAQQGQGMEPDARTKQTAMLPGQGMPQGAMPGSLAAQVAAQRPQVSMPMQQGAMQPQMAMAMHPQMSMPQQGMPPQGAMQAATLGPRGQIMAPPPGQVPPGANPMAGIGRKGGPMMPSAMPPQAQQAQQAQALMAQHNVAMPMAPGAAPGSAPPSLASQVAALGGGQSRALPPSAGMASQATQATQAPRPAPGMGAAPIMAQGAGLGLPPQSAPVRPPINAAPPALAGMRPMVSDEREKDVDPNAPSREDVQAMLDNLHAYSYRYKDESMPGALPGKQLGIMAQDMEKSPLGSQFVKESDEGHKVIDSRQMLSTLLASNAYLNERVNGLEGKKKKG